MAGDTIPGPRKILSARDQIWVGGVNFGGQLRRKPPLAGNGCAPSDSKRRGTGQQGIYGDSHVFLVSLDEEKNYPKEAVPKLICVNY